MDDPQANAKALEPTVARVAASLAGLVGLELLLLVGSRARNEARPDSDWDVAYLGSPSLDPLELVRRLTMVLGTDDVDVADLRTASVLFQHRAAVEGVRIIGSKETYEDFVVRATRIYLDMEPILRRAYRSVLDEAAR